MTVPPSSNTGAEVTEVSAPTENRVLIDFLSWTLKTTDPHEAISLCGLDGFDWSNIGGGGMGYRYSLRCGNMVVFYDGRDDMGCHISFSGNGCRQFETGVTYTYPWLSLLETLSLIGAKITRLDLAIDNVDGNLRLDYLNNSIDACEIRSRFKFCDDLRRRSLSRSDAAKNSGSAAPLGETIYLGSKTSRFLIRFYDKAAQYKLDTHWVRCELQCRKERAQQAAKYLLDGVSAGDLAFSSLNQYFAVINLDDSNISRCTLKEWWAAWLHTTSKLKLTVAKAQKYIHHVVSYLQRQYSATFAMLRKYYGVIGFHDFMSSLVTTGNDKLTRKHDSIISMSRVFASDLPF